MEVKVSMLGLVLLILALALTSALVFADPQGPTGISEGADERRSDNSPVVVQAQAGNVTSLTINATRITNRWQGYYGNVTGTITLDDAGNNTLYEWNLASPKGEIYAVNDSVIPTWSDVYCFNFSNNKSAGEPIVQRFNGSDLENALGMNPDDNDGVDETFNLTFTGTFQVGLSTIDSSSGCSSVSLHVSDSYDQLKFNETMLTDNNSIIFTTILEDDATGFQGSTLDFQMIVGENGDTINPTNYYFYVELT
jgi:hypothetical protein